MAIEAGFDELESGDRSRESGFVRDSNSSLDSSEAQMKALDIVMLIDAL
jgi:hypothetical protein